MPDAGCRTIRSLGLLSGGQRPWQHLRVAMKNKQTLNAKRRPTAIMNLQQNFHLFPQFTHVTNVVIGSSALLVWSW